MKSWRSSSAFVLSLLKSVIRSQETWHNSLAVTISRLNQLLITLVHRYAGCTLGIMWSGNIQNFFWKCLYFFGIWTRHLRRREQSLYQLGHITLISILPWLSSDGPKNYVSYCNLLWWKKLYKQHCQNLTHFLNYISISRSM